MSAHLPLCPATAATERVRSVLRMLTDSRGAFVSKETALLMIADALDEPEEIAADEEEALW